MFPDGKFIFLWRNPLAVAASIMTSWAEGHWNLYRYKIDLFAGLDSLLHSFESHQHDVLSLRFEDLVTEPEMAVQGTLDYLGVEFTPELIDRFDEVNLHGLGDKVGVQRYARLSSEPLEKWQAAFRNPFRRRWARQYMLWIGRDRLAMAGYDLDEICGELSQRAGSPQFLASDVIRSSFGILYSALELRIARQKLGSRTWRDVHAHN